MISVDDFQEIGQSEWLYVPKKRKCFGREGQTLQEFVDEWNFSRQNPPTEPTQDELNAAAVAKLFSRQNDILKALGMVCLQLGNQVRALQAHTGLTRAELKALEGANAVTPSQFKEYVKGLMT